MIQLGEDYDLHRPCILIDMTSRFGTSLFTTLRLGDGHAATHSDRLAFFVSIIASRVVTGDKGEDVSHEKNDLKNCHLLLPLESYCVSLPDYKVTEAVWNVKIPA
jgi:hypothetical protein